MIAIGVSNRVVMGSMKEIVVRENGRLGDREDEDDDEVRYIVRCATLGVRRWGGGLRSSV